MPILHLMIKANHKLTKLRKDSFLKCEERRLIREKNYKGTLRSVLLSLDGLVYSSLGRMLFLEIWKDHHSILPVRFTAFNHM